jgi:NAD-dependent deacetylase
MIREAEYTIALTGAGISTPSGIPDFRSSGSGLWHQDNPMEVASLDVFRHNPQRFYDWARPLTAKILIAQPNAAHIALADLEDRNFLMGIVTQNIDDLHNRAGSKMVVEIHGHMREATCVQCFQITSSSQFIQEYVSGDKIPTCATCGGILKPNTVLFGEQLPYHAVAQAKDLFSACDLILVIGSYLEVTPVSLFPVEALNRGAKLIIVNWDPTYLDSRADVVFHHDRDEIVPRIASEVLNE